MGSPRLGGALSVLLALLGVSLVDGRALQDGSSNAGPCTPLQIHVSLTGNPTELRVSWKTRGGSCPSTVSSGPAAALDSNPVNPAMLTAHHGSQHSYSSGDMCAAPARQFHTGPTYLHTAVLTGLQPGQPFFYQIEGGETVRFTAPVPAGPTHSFRFLVFGDMGESEHRAAKSPGASRTMQQLQREYEAGAELIMHVGDISYANGKEEIWDVFMDSIEPFARHIPYMVGVGNHEYDYERRGGKAAGPDASGEEEPYRPDWFNSGNDSGGECGVQISKRFAMPDVADFGYWTQRLHNGTGNGSSSGDSDGSAAGGQGNPTLGPDAAQLLEQALAAAGKQQEQQGARAAGSGGSGAMGADSLQLPRPNPPFWYSFSHGSVHFVVVSTEHDLSPGSKQFRWLERDLQLVDRCVTPWVVLSMHRPMYVVYPHKSNRIVGDHLRDNLEGLLNEYQVDLVVSGHVHSYSRSCNVLDEECIPADRGGMTHIIVGCAGRKLTDVAHFQEDWLEYAAVRFGYGRVTVDSGYSLLFELVGDDGSTHDSVKLHNSRANMRGCSYADAGEAAAVQAASAAAAADASPCQGCAGGLLQARWQPDSLVAAALA